MLAKPTKIIVAGVPYTVSYHDSPVEVDLYKRQSLWGQIDYWTHTIRIYDKDNPPETILETLLHEVLHGLAEHLNLKTLKAEAGHEDLGVLALGLMDFLTRNNWISLE